MSPFTAIIPMTLTMMQGAMETTFNAVTHMGERMQLVTSKVSKAPLNGKVCIVTGGNAGIGFALAEQLAGRGAHVILACRDMGRANSAAEKLRHMPLLPGAKPPKVEAVALDLADLTSVNKFADTFNRRKLPLHLLVCNAGLMSPASRLQTKDGFEMQFQVNFLGHWLLTNKLIAEQRRRRLKQQRKMLLDAEAQGDVSGLPDGASRVLILTSMTHLAGVLQWHDMQSTQSYSPFLSYALTKLCNVLAAKELQDRFDRAAPKYGKGDVAVSVHPGVVDTALAVSFFKDTGAAAGKKHGLKDVASGAVDAIKPILLRTPEQSARDTVLYAALAPAKEVAGKYVADGRVMPPAEAAQEAWRGKELWDYAVKLTGLHQDPSLV